MPVCFVVGCSNRSTRTKPTNSGTSYHRFPKNETRRVQWLTAIGRDPNHFIIHETVCSEHFNDADVVKIRRRRQLNETAMPVKNLPNSLLPRSLNPSYKSVSQEHFNTQLEYAIPSTSQVSNLTSFVPLHTGRKLRNKEVTCRDKDFNPSDLKLLRSALLQLPNTETLKQIISHSEEPLIFKNLLSWDILRWKLSDWQRVLGDEELTFRCGKNSYTEEPQWENTTSTVKGSFEFFLEQQSDQHKWMYFDYKYLKEWLLNAEELQKNISWKEFGFSDYGFKDSTIWIGSKGAHTPCHIDSYGFNLIAQVYGRKLWFMCPPDTDLCPTRVPYEESSIFSNVNFFCPSSCNIDGVNNGRLVVLNPGDVLFLPHGWWHYVENLETAISINVWLPHPDDDSKRVDESLVQLLVSQFVKELSEDEQKLVLIPSKENEKLRDVDIHKSLGLMEQVLQLQTANVTKRRRVDETEAERRDFNLAAELDKYSHSVNVVPPSSTEDLRRWMVEQRGRFEGGSEMRCKNNVEKLLNAMLNPEVINLIRNKLDY